MIHEKTLIDHCSLTLSSLKTASLFTVKHICLEKLCSDIIFWNEKFMQSGVKLILLKTINKSALIYMYREDMLKKDLSSAAATKILKLFSYKDNSIEYTLKKLSARLSTYDEFPHEIGLFLGYPPEDVYGFICNKGQNCNLCKYWKVYANEEEALIKFARYDKCKAIYKKLWQEGRDILKLTVKNQAVA